MKLRTEMKVWSDGNWYPSLNGEQDVYIALEHDAMAAHALMQAMEEALQRSGDDYAPIPWIEQRADELMRKWTKQDEVAK